MQDLDGGPRGREILRRFYNRARDTRRSFKERQSSLPLAPGPHLLTDWRYVLSSEVSGGFTWVTRETGEPVRVTDEHGEYTTDPIDAVMVPYDVPEGVRISVCKAERSDPVPNHEPPGQVCHSQGFYRTWYRPIPLGQPYASLLDGGVYHAESDDGYSWRNRTACTFDLSDCPDVEAWGPFPGVFEDPVAPERERFKMVFQGRSIRPEFAHHRQEVLEEFMERHESGFDPTALSFDGPNRTPVIRLARYGAVSPDGIRWNVLRQPLMILYSDSQNVVYYDTNRQSYVWFLKTQWYDGRRSIGRYGGARYPHKYPRNRHTWDAMKGAYALWTKERITALIADEAGRFTTLPLLFDGRRLRLNYRTTQGGEIRVEAAESRRSGGHSKALPGRSFADCVPLAGDETDRIVAWKTGEDLGHRDGQPVTLRFRMRSASLFAFELSAGP